MSRRLASLDLLRGFEATARHLSFTAAAQELFLTQSAVSRQVQALEAQIGVSLFERGHRSIALTEAGHTLLRAVTPALAQVDGAIDRIRQSTGGRAVTLTCTIGFASLWLIPRLAQFRESHPEIDLRISANSRVVDLEREQIDVAIRYVPLPNAPAGGIRLFGEESCPVCSPALVAAGQRPLVRPEDLRHQILLRIDDEHLRRPFAAWEVWLELVNLPDLVPRGTLHFSHYDQLIQAAIAGQGVAIGVFPLVQRLIDEGRLVTPFPEKYASPRAYYAMSSPASAHRPEVRQFIDWLVDEVRRDQPAGGRLQPIA